MAGEGLSASDQEFLQAMFANLTGPVNVDWNGVSQQMGIAYERNTRSRYLRIAKKMGWPVPGSSAAGLESASPRTPKKTPRTRAPGSSGVKKSTGRMGTKSASKLAKNAMDEEDDVDDPESPTAGKHVKKEDPDLQLQPQGFEDPAYGSYTYENDLSKYTYTNASAYEGEYEV